MRELAAEDAGMIRHEVLRGLDRWLGVPACALLSVMRRIAGALNPPASPGNVERVLFIQLAESGSMVLADPAMRAVAAHAQPYCLTFAGNRHSLAITGTVDQAFVFPLRVSSFAVLLTDTWRFLRWVRANRIDAVIDCELFSRLSAVLCLLSGVRLRAGFQRMNDVGLYRGKLYTHPVAFDPQQHMTQNYLALAHALFGAVPPPALPQRRFSTSEQDALRARLPSRLKEGRLVLVNANASSRLPQRRWPESSFVALIRRLLHEYDDARVLLIGATEDRTSTAAIAAQIRDERCVDGAGLFRLAELPALYSLSAALVSNDSGPAHFAAVTTLPIIVLFGPETPVLFRPLGRATVLSANLTCSPCVNVGNQRRTRCRDNQCMQQITVEQVFNALRAVLDAKPRMESMSRETVRA